MDESRMITPENPSPKMERFLEAVALTGNLTTAAKLAGCCRDTHKDWMRENQNDYRKRFATAKKMAGELLEQEAYRRAVQGVKRLKFQGGEALIDPNTKQPYVEYEYSDTLLIFLLKGVLPEKYRERYDHKVKGEHEVGLDWDRLTRDGRADGNGRSDAVEKRIEDGSRKLGEEGQ